MNTILEKIIGALFLTALLFGLFTNQISFTGSLQTVAMAAVAAALGFIAFLILPKSRTQRRKHAFLTALSYTFTACACIGLLTAFNHCSLLAATHCGVAMAATPAVLTEEQIREFSNTLSGLKTALSEYKDMFPKLRSLMPQLESVPELQRKINDIKRAGLGMFGQETGVRWIGNKPFVTDDCAKALTACFVVDCARLGEKGLASLIPNEGRRQPIFQHACAVLGMETRTAMTSTEVPLPTIYMPQVIELVYMYGQARQFATVFPLGGGTTKLPRLKAGEDDFGYLGVGTAGGLSQTVQEKRVTAELVTFDPSKMGGIIRLPFELEEDTFIPIGQFLGRYVARQFAKMEDKTLFLADGTSAYGNQTGIGKYCDTNPTYRLQLGAGLVSPNDATLDDWRNLRSQVSAAVLAGGFDAAYYINPTFEPKLRSFNKYPNFVVFENQNGKPMFDGWPVRWIGVSQAFTTGAAPSSYIGFFGSLPYWYLGERGTPRVEVSREVFFATDELAMRALERIDVEAMAIDAMATLKTAAA